MDGNRLCRLVYDFQTVSVFIYVRISLQWLNGFAKIYYRGNGETKVSRCVLYGTLTQCKKPLYIVG